MNMISKRLMRPELLVLVLMTTIIAMLIIPLPTWLIDALIAVNMVTAALIFVGSFHIQSIVSFSSFPALLLVTTVFRLALSITTSRMILLEGDAGAIVASFGHFVIAGDLVIGMTIFAIVTLVQFMVITKGSERVAEVCARFSLDGLPGKQMSIDADLRANVINGDQARSQRRLLEQESQLYGSLDGAVKFVKGDALAGILIIFVNFLGGVAIGVLRNGDSFSQALETYTLLTVGDGLVTQIPALLISIATGFIVTRVNADDENLGTTILKQLGAKNEVLLTAAALSIGAGFLPGFPFAVFALIAMGLVGIFVVRKGGWRKALSAEGTTGSGESLSGAKELRVKGAGAGDGPTTGVGDVMPEAVALAVLLPSGQKAWASRVSLGVKLEHEVFTQFGVKIPEVEIKESATLGPHSALILVNEIGAGEIRVNFGKHKVTDGADMLLACGTELTDLSDGKDASYWIEESAAERERRKEVPSFYTRSDVEELVETFSVIVARHIGEIFGIQEAKNLLDQLEGKYPELVKECLRNAPVQRIANVLQRLVLERISIRNLKGILEAIAQWAPKERDNIMLCEHVRSTLGRYITDKFSRGRRLNVLVLSSEHEEKVRRSVQQTANGVFANLSPDDTQSLIDAISARLKGIYLSLDDIVLLTSADTRRFVKRVIEQQYPQLDVLSYTEITDQSLINVIHAV
ncbi:EscV/YscV/HrcV family type III secretion system export apparatus protein [Ralstonia mojiangensis]|uniref:EscV/YscV/HrcV family type III secretion system export apparatus protein n=1 Tax=Ralstonia mojiangensis TaxID=2953895 RepID=UPI0020906140|nr:EscV/YscV/HrcV family type III secretion system export apparatus protein [Ralstonia mojiangensis]MCO5413475.1 EscV/YscV/HrcV family type III secretion system export apparatus protein [Ralstonia mojiangensis]